MRTSSVRQLAGLAAGPSWPGSSTSLPWRPRHPRVQPREARARRSGLEACTKPLRRDEGRSAHPRPLTRLACQRGGRRLRAAPSTRGGPGSLTWRPDLPSLPPRADTSSIARVHGCRSHAPGLHQPHARVGSCDRPAWMGALSRLQTGPSTRRIPRLTAGRANRCDLVPLIFRPIDLVSGLLGEEALSYGLVPGGGVFALIRERRRSPPWASIPRRRIATTRPPPIRG
jgi:hypothetical protein